MNKRKREKDWEEKLIEVSVQEYQRGFINGCNFMKDELRRGLKRLKISARRKELYRKKKFNFKGGTENE